MPAEQTNAAFRAFQDRILNDLLPEFCNDPSRAWDVAAFRQDWHKIHEVDAADFLRGIDGDLLKHEGRGLYRAPQSRASEQFFWSGSKKKSPRPTTLWAEPIITVAVLARLHFDLGWPKALIGTQSKDWAFDAATYLPGDLTNKHIACEVKKSVIEVDHLIEHVTRFGKMPNADQCVARNGKELNAFRKFDALRHRRPPLFWAVGPGGQSSSYAFRMEYGEEGMVSFQQIAFHELGYQAGISSTAS